MFITALFTIAKIWAPPKYLSTNKWIKKVWCVYVYVLLFFNQSLLTLLWPHGLYIVHQASLSMGFPRQEYLSGMPFSSPGDLLNPRIKPMSPALVDRFSTTESIYICVCMYVHMYMYMWHTHIHTNTYTHMKNWYFETGAGEDSWNSLGLQGDQTSQS